MKQLWPEQDLIAFFTLSSDERRLVAVAARNHKRHGLI